MDTHFGMHNYSLKDLFRDEQRNILHRIIAGTLQEFADKFTSLYENSRGLMGFLRETGMPVPQRFMTTAETALNLRLQQMFTTGSYEMSILREVVSEIKDWHVAVDGVSLEFIIRRRLEGAMGKLQEEPENELLLHEVLNLVESIAALPIEVNLWQAQNMYWDMVQFSSLNSQLSTEESDDYRVRSEVFNRLGQLLYFNMQAVLAA
jgi:hypothetical protein